MTRRAPSTPRSCGAILAIWLLGSIGPVAVFVGVLSQQTIEQVYTVDFAYVGQECVADTVVIDIATGARLVCARRFLGPVSSAGAHIAFPGFTDEQNREVEMLTRRPGRGELSPQDQADIQALVNTMAAGLSDAERAHYSQALAVGPLWGTRLTAAGIVMVVAALALFFGTRRRP